jgi:CheY-like chemotaxis protein
MNGTVLIVEDEENDAFLLKTALKKAGIPNPIQVVENGRLALDYLAGSGEFSDRETHPLPSVIFLDLKLPQVNGLEILKWIREEPSLPPIVVVVLTSSSLDEDIDRAYRLGANSYVVKPSSRDKLVAIVNDFGNWWFKHNEPPPNRVSIPVGSV